MSVDSATAGTREARQVLYVPVSGDEPGQVKVAPFTRVVTRYERYGKRVLDLVLGSVALILLSPLFLITALLVRTTMGKGVFYTQERVGKGARPFKIYKFRSMRHDRRRREIPVNGSDRRQTHKTDRDPRHTKVGRLIRKLSLDELPQLVNVLKGDMSLVGPRPELVSVAQKHGIVDHPRHLVRPGITGPWQLSKHRHELIYLHLEPDEDYVRKVTFWGDVKLLLRTFVGVFRGGGE